MGISVAIASIFSTLLTQFLKGKKPENLTEEQIKSRKRGVRALNALLTLVGLVLGVVLTGAEIDLASLESSVETIVTYGVSYLTAQGGYALYKS